MKKVFLVLILFLSCYFIYNITIDKKIFYLTIGDFLSKGTNEYGSSSYGYNNFVKDYLEKDNKLKIYNQVFTDNDYQINDILKFIEYNESKNEYTLNRLIKEADIITISLGMNEIYYKLERNNQNIYTYIDNMMSNYQKILEYINKFHHQKVFILGYYNTLGSSNDVFDYANYKLQKLCNEYKFIYLNLSKIFDNNPNYLVKLPNFVPNIDGYEKISQLIVENLSNS